jgi:purine-nucleoside phosphorylase
MDTYDKIQKAKKFVEKKITAQPEIGIVLGSGLGELAETVEGAVAVGYGDIPNFKKPSVAGHAGRLVAGKLGSKDVAVLQGRYHFYEGHSIEEVVFPVRVLCALGIKKLILTNAAGGINTMLEPGNLMIITDHINLMGANPLAGPNDDRLGVRFPDMTHIYDPALVDVLASTMSDLGLGVKKGVYAGLLGPSYETPAEIRMLAAMGADAVGMSTVPEAIAAHHMGTAVAGISCVTNLAAGISSKPLDHKEVTETADRVKGHFIRLITEAVGKF